MSFAISVAALCALSHVAFAQELLIHLPLDGQLQNTGAAGGQAVLHVKAGESAPTSVTGKFGNALHFTGGAALALPFNLSPEDFPQITITAWVKLDPGYKGEHVVVSSGNGNGPRLTVLSGKALVTAARSTAMFAQTMPKDEWVFVAGVADIADAQARVYQGAGQLVKESINTANLYAPTAYKDPDNPDAERTPYLFVGSHGFSQWPAKDMSIDDVRVYAGALTEEQIDDLRNASAAPARALASQPSGAALSAPTPADRIASQGLMPELFGDKDRPPGDGQAGALAPQEVRAGTAPGAELSAPTPADRVASQGMMPKLFGDKDRPPGDELNQAGAAPGAELSAPTPADRIASQGLMPELFGDKDRPPGDGQPGTLAPQEVRAGTLPAQRSDLSSISDSKIPQAAAAVDRTSTGEPEASASTPPYVAGGTANSQAVRDVLQDKQAETALPDLTYASEQEAQAAADKRAREQGQAELDRQQNELEAQRRAAAEASGETTTRQGLGSADAAGSGEIYMTGDPAFSAVSGYPGENQEIIQLDSDYMHEIFWREVSANRPSYFFISGGSSQDAEHKDWGVNNKPGRSGARKVALGFDTAINSLSVCTNSTAYNRRLKGMIVKGDKINADGTMTYQPASSTETMPNCNNWHTTVLCPSDYAGVGLVIHFNGAATSRSAVNVTGLQLVCRKIAVR